MREAYSAVRLLDRALDLCQLYNLRPVDLSLDENEMDTLSPLGFCHVWLSFSRAQTDAEQVRVSLQVLAERKGYKTQRGRGAADPHRAGLEVLKDTIDGIPAMPSCLQPRVMKIASCLHTCSPASGL